MYCCHSSSSSLPLVRYNFRLFSKSSSHSSPNFIITCAMKSFEMFLGTCKWSEVRCCQIQAARKCMEQLKIWCSVMPLKWQHSCWAGVMLEHYLSTLTNTSEWMFQHFMALIPWPCTPCEHASVAQKINEHAFFQQKVWVLNFFFLGEVGWWYSGDWFFLNSQSHWHT